MKRVVGLLMTLVALQLVAVQPVVAGQVDKGPVHQTGEGLLCYFGVLVIAAEVADRCFQSTDAEMRSELHRSVAIVEKFIVDNNKVTPADIEQFKKTQGHTGAPTQLLCKGDTLRLYEELRKRGPNQLRQSTEEAVSRPGVATWGTCF